MDNLKNIDLYQNISQLITNSKTSIKASINSAVVITYWNIGKLIVEDEQHGEERAQYGKETVKNLSIKLTSHFGKGFDYRNLQSMKKFYIYFPKVNAVRSQLPIRDAVRPELSWTHYRSILRVENKEARDWYVNEAILENWSTRALDRQISTQYYQRLLASKDKAPVIEEANNKIKNLTAHDILKDPYILEFLNIKQNTSYTEKDLESAIINDIQKFLLELGKGFSFVSRQKRIDLDNKHFYIDLVFYNFKLKCFVLIDLKTGELTHQDIGQMDTYIRIYEDKIKQDDDNPTIGIILCADKNETLVKYSMLKDSEQLFASKYQLYLPTEEELKQELNRELSILKEQGVLYYDNY